MSAVQPLVAVVPAAGSSSRFGSMKLVADVDGRPLLERTLQSLLDAAVDRIVLVVAPGHDFVAVPLVADPRVVTVINPDPSRGMFSSIQVGLESDSVAGPRPEPRGGGEALASSTAGVILVLPADMPFVPPDVIATVTAVCRDTGRVVVPTQAGRRGHPAAIPARHRAGLLAAPATSDLKTTLRTLAVEPPLEVDVESRGILRDVDVPEDLRLPRV
jgi:molybdenum cofactor cytidylyltransferase